MTGQPFTLISEIMAMQHTFGAMVDMRALLVTPRYVSGETGETPEETFRDKCKNRAKREFLYQTPQSVSPY